MKQIEELIAKLTALREKATRTHTTHTNDPDNPKYEKADYCHLCWQLTKAKDDFFCAAVNAIPELEAALAAQPVPAGLSVEQAFLEWLEVSGNRYSSYLNPRDLFKAGFNAALRQPTPAQESERERAQRWLMGHGIDVPDSLAAEFVQARAEALKPLVEGLREEVGGWRKIATQDEVAGSTLARNAAFLVGKEVYLKCADAIEKRISQPDKGRETE